MKNQSVLEESEFTCVACGTALQGRFCHSCGEQLYDRRQHSCRSILREACNTLTQADHKVRKSLRLLFFQPGFLTREYINGRKRRFVKPMALFVAANVVFYFMQPLVDIKTFDSTLQEQISAFPYSPLAKSIVQARLQAGNQTLEEYEPVYNATAGQLAKTLLLVQIPVFALFLWVLQLTLRGYYFEHLVFATHFYAFFVFLNVLATLAVFLHNQLGGTAAHWEGALLLMLSAYLALALRRAYGQPWSPTLIKCILLVAVVMVVNLLYRFLIFVLTVAAT